MSLVDAVELTRRLKCNAYSIGGSFRTIETFLGKRRNSPAVERPLNARAPTLTDNGLSAGRAG